MREAKFTASAARASSAKPEQVPDEVMKRPAPPVEPAKPAKAKQKIPSRPMGKAKKPKG